MIEKDHCKLQVSSFSRWDNDVMQAITLHSDEALIRTKKSIQNKGESNSPVVPFEVINIGNSKAEKLTDFVKELEIALGISASMNFTAMQAKAVLTTFADCFLLDNLIDFMPKTPILDRISAFLD